MTWIHDTCLLWLIQEGMYAHSLLTALLLIGLTAALPQHHRKLWWCVMGPVDALCLACLVVYGVWGVSPLLFVVMLALLIYHATRWVHARVQAHASIAHMPAWLCWASWPLNKLARDYVQIDPRASYWIDLARAERGIPVERSPAQRRESLELRQLGSLSRRLWWLWLWLVEVRIQGYRWLCSAPLCDPVNSSFLLSVRSRLAAWFRLPQPTLALLEPHLTGELSARAETAASETLLHWTARSYQDYFDRRSQVHEAEMKLAAVSGRRWMRHREALVELQTLRAPWSPGEDGLETAARFTYATWQLRRQYDHLWHGPADRSVSEPVGMSHAESFASLQSAASTDDDARHSQDAFDSRESPVDDEAGEVLEATGANTAASANDASSPNSSAHSTVHSTLSSASNSASISTSSSASTTGPAAVGAPLSDEELFASRSSMVTATEEKSVDAEYSLAANTPRDRERLSDLSLGIRLLNAYLDLGDSRARDLDEKRLSRLFQKDPAKRSAILLLVTFHSLAEKYRASRQVLHERDLMAPWVTLVRDLVKRTRGKKSAEVARRGPSPEETLAREFEGNYQLDVLYERQAFHDLRTLLSRLSGLSPYQFKLLADAETQLAARLDGQPQLQTMLRLDAISHYYQAGFPGLWTLDIARLLINGISTRQELHAKFKDNMRVVQSSQSSRIHHEDQRPPRATRRATSASSGQAASQS